MWIHSTPNTAICVTLSVRCWRHSHTHPRTHILLHTAAFSVCPVSTFATCRSQPSPRRGPATLSIGVRSRHAATCIWFPDSDYSLHPPRYASASDWFTIQMRWTFASTLPPIQQLFVFLVKIHKHSKCETGIRSVKERRRKNENVYLMRSFASFGYTLGLLEMLSVFVLKSGNSYSCRYFCLHFQQLVRRVHCAVWWGY